MAKAGKKLLAVALVGAGAYGAWTLGSSLLSGDSAETEATRHVVNQVWIERLPSNQRDMIGHLVIVDHPQGKLGAAGRSSNWRHVVEVFMWKLQGHRLDLYFPQEEVHAAVKVRSYDCEGDAPEPFQLCLEISNGNRSITYYSRKDWKIEPHEGAEAFEDLVEDYPELAGVFEGPLVSPIDADDLDVDDFRVVDSLPLD